ncbi:hypothetical protein CcrJ4_gp495c [Caulobacter phage J4]|nr:hypothetical protein CcrJ4_gp495c [Caulobacter phage J4]
MVTADAGVPALAPALTRARPGITTGRAPPLRAHPKPGDSPKLTQKRARRPKIGRKTAKNGHFDPKIHDFGRFSAS